MASVKLNYKGEYRRVLLSTSKLTLVELKNKAVQIFPSLLDQTLIFSWVDEDGDVIKFSSDEELQDALHYHLQDGKGVLKFDIATANNNNTNNNNNNVNNNGRSQNEEKPVHNHVVCDECGVNPITGIRYKCAVRENFDLCENCEAANIQPYPMIKIYHPDQAPMAILIALRDEEHGPPHHGRHHHGRHPHGRHPHGPPPHGPPPHGGPFGGLFGGPPHHPGGSFGGRGGPCGGGPFGGRGCPPPHHRMEKWARKFCPGFADVFDRSSSTSTSASCNAAPVPTTATAVDVNADVCPAEAVDIEQKIIDEVIRLSVEESIAKNSTSTSSTSSASASSQVAAEKPKARFVKDVTYPDGTTVQPGTHFMKIWRIRNDGNADWSNDNVLVAAGGDELSSVDLRIPLPSIPAGQESDISVELVAPERSGRHVAYFRLQTADGTSFGHRLWADIRVVEDIASSLDWQVVNEMLHSSDNVSPQPLGQDAIPSESITSSSSSVVTPVSESIEETQAPSSLSSSSSSNTSTILAPTAVVGVLINDTSSTSSVAPASTTVTATPASTDMATDIWCRVYETELKVLRDMGFSDVNVIIPLLREHIGMPVSRNPDLQGQPSAEGMQRVVIQLLGQSMTL